MDIIPILLSLSRQKTGAVLIALQAALALSLVSNVALIVQSKLNAMNLSTGIDEENTALIFNQWAGSSEDYAPRITADLQRLRSLPDVKGAYATNSVPLGLAGTTLGVHAAADQDQPVTQAALYHVDEQALNTLGISMRAGRWFEPQEVEPAVDGDSSTPPIVIITQALAQRLFGSEAPVGKSIYLNAQQPSTVIGVIDRMVSPYLRSPYALHAVLAPYTSGAQRHYYVLRAQDGRANEVLKSAMSALRDQDDSRVFGFALTFPEWRHRIHDGDRAAAVVLSTVSAALLLVTAIGIVGLSSYWVARRRRQIGIRRALGARRIDIVRYFQLENLLIMIAGVSLGCVGAVATNLVLSDYVEIPRFDAASILFGALLMVSLGQLSVLWPALRAATTPPALAARSV